MSRLDAWCRQVERRWMLDIAVGLLAGTMWASLCLVVVNRSWQDSDQVMIQGQTLLQETRNEVAAFRAEAAGLRQALSERRSWWRGR